MMSVLSKWKIALYLLAIFCAGAVSGWVIAAKTAKEKMFAPPRPDEIANSFRTRVHSKVNPTPEQATKIDGIIDKSSKEIQTMHTDCTKRIRQAITERNSQITGVLDPEQRKQFEKMEKERQEAWRSHEPWRNRGPGLPPHDWRFRGPRDRSRTNSVNKEGGQPPAPIRDDSKPAK
jgi:hypothetical protein